MISAHCRDKLIADNDEKEDNGHVAFDRRRALNIANEYASTANEWRRILLEGHSSRVLEWLKT